LVQKKGCLQQLFVINSFSIVQKCVGGNLYDFFFRVEQNDAERFVLMSELHKEGVTHSSDGKPIEELSREDLIFELAKARLSKE